MGYESKCLSCKKFWKICDDENEKCYLGGSNGGRIDYCTGYNPITPCNNQFCPMKNGEVSNKCKFEDCPYRTNEKPKAEELAMFLMKKVFEGNNGKNNRR